MSSTGVLDLWNPNVYGRNISLASGISPRNNMVISLDIKKKYSGFHGPLYYRNSYRIGSSSNFKPNVIINVKKGNVKIEFVEDFDAIKNNKYYTLETNVPEGIIIKLIIFFVYILINWYLLKSNIIK